MKRLHRFRALIPACLLACTLLRADIVILKSGEKVEGKVLSENDTSITIEYKLTPKIKDTKVINKADIKELTRFTPAQLEMDERGLRKELPTADLLTSGDYESIIQDKLRPFVAKFPGTPEAAEVEKMIVTLGEEKSKVLSGQAKVEGRWLDEATTKREAYNIDAYRVRMAMKARAAEPKADNLLAALREFDKLQTSYGASMHYIAAIPEALELMDKYEKQLAGMSAEFPALDKQRKDGLKVLQGSDLALTKSSIDQEVRNFKTTSDAQSKLKVKWRDVYRYDLKSITDALAALGKERQVIRAIDLTALQSETETLNAAIRYIADGNATEAEAMLAKIRDRKALIINKVEFAKIDKELKALIQKQKDLARAAKASTTAVAGSTTAEPGAESSNPIADAMKDKEKKKDESKSEPKKADKEDATTKKTGVGKTETAKTPSTTPVAAPPEEEQSTLEKINAYIPYVGGGLLVVLVIAMLMGKKKKDDD